MKLRIILSICSAVFLFVSSVVIATASDFDWITDFNIRSEADPIGFRARIGARFKISDLEINAVFRNVEKPADVYMIFRLAEMSGKPRDYVIEKYKSKKGKGWGALAKSLGIEPGSREFHALKRGDDLYDGNDKDMGKGKDKGKGKGKDKGRD